MTAEVAALKEQIWTSGMAAPDAVFVLGEENSIATLVPLIRQKLTDPYFFVPSMFTGPERLLPKLPSGSRLNVFVSSGLPPVPDPLFRQLVPLHPLVVAYKNATKAIGAMFNHTEVSTSGLKGYLAARFLLKVIDDVVPPLTASALLDAVYATGVYGVVSLRLGEFCDEDSHCDAVCNQGGHSVWINALNESYFTSLRQIKVDTCGAASGDAPIVIGQTIRLLLPASGPLRRLGLMAAFEQANAFGGINGRRVSLISYENLDNPVLSVNNTRELLENDGVLGLAAYLGFAHIQPTIAALPPIFARLGEKVAFIGPYTGIQDFLDSSRTFVIMMRATIYEEADTAVAYLEQAGFDLNRVALISTIEPVGVQYRDAFIQGMASHGYSPIASVSWDRFKAVPTSAITPIAALRERIQTIVLTGPGFEAYYAAVKLVADPSTTYFVYVSGTITTVAQGLLDNNTVLYSSQAVPAPRPATDEFLVAYQAAVAIMKDSPLYMPTASGPMEDSPNALEGYVVGVLIVNALQRFAQRQQAFTRTGFLNMFLSGDPFEMGTLMRVGPWNPTCTAGSTNSFVTKFLPNGTMQTVYNRALKRSCIATTPAPAAPALTSGLVIALSVGVAAVVVVVITIAVLAYRRKKSHYVIDTRGQGVIPFEKLTFIQPIGLGSFGEVFYGMYANSEVAIKRLLKRDITARDMQTFMSETSMTIELRHPSIVLFMGVCTEWPNLCIITEFMERGNLFDNLHQNLEIHKSMMYKWARDVASGLSYLHGRSVAHQDLKSLNVLVSREWGCKLCDFGMSQFKNREDSNEGWVGTVFWCAPEVLKNGTSTLKSDIYSFGVVLWEIFTRREPWQGESQHAATIKVIGGTRLSLDGVPPELVPIISRCWETSPGARPTAEQVRDELARMSPASEAITPVPHVRPPLGVDGAYLGQLVINDCGRWYSFRPAAFNSQVERIDEVVERIAADLKASPVLVDGETYRYLFHTATDAIAFCRSTHDALKAIKWALLDAARSPAALNRRVSVDHSFQHMPRPLMAVSEGDMSRTLPLPLLPREERPPSDDGPVVYVTLADLVSLSAHYGKTSLGKDAARGAVYSGPSILVMDRTSQAQPPGTVWASEAVERQTGPWGESSKKTVLEISGSAITFSVLAESPNERRVVDITGSVDTGWYLRPTELLVSSAPEERMGVGTYAQAMPALLRNKSVVFKLFANQRLDAKKLMQFRRDSASLCKLSHPNVLGMLAIVSFPPRAGIVFTYVRKGSLQILLTEESPRNSRDQLRIRRQPISLQAAEGLAYLHSQNIRHGSLNCSNVLFDSDWKVLLSDYGLETLKIVMQTMTHVDKSAWMAPETINGEASTLAGDVYCFGMLLWSIAACELPFKSLTRLAALHRVLQGETPPISDSWHPEVGRLLRLCWAPNPSNRPAMSEVVSILRPLRSFEAKD